MAAVNWSGVKGAIGTIAPWLAGTLGSPVAGMAVGALCQVLGLEPGKATPATLQAAIAGATPDQLLAIRQADLQHAEVMKKLGYDHVDKIEQLDVDDLASARAREMAVRDTTPAVMAWMIVLGTLCACGAVLSGVVTFADATKANMVGMVIGYLVSESKAVLAYYFGSSRGSDAKNQIIADQAASQSQQQ